MPLSIGFKGIVRQRLDQLKAISDRSLKTAIAVTLTTGSMAENLTQWSQDLQNFEPEAVAYDRATVTTRDTGIGLVLELRDTTIIAANP